jgi:dTDP-glucose 4,6-dehydratase
MNDAFEQRILVTGGAGFIGSHVVKHLVQKYPSYHIINFDALTYAGSLDNVKEVADAANYTFIQGDITDAAAVDRVFSRFGITQVIHLAAESHVDRSIANPLAFIDTNIRGTAVLLNACRANWSAAQQSAQAVRFYHISTDEVFGALGETGSFSETTPYDPRSPYSASKASADHLVRAYHHTYGLPVVISNCSNNYGTHQYPEKLIPVIVRNIANGQPLPVYGQGTNVRDWLAVEDHVAAIDLILHRGKVGETYCVGGDNEWRNIDLVHLLCRLVEEDLGLTAGWAQSLITYVTDRAGHDYRYAIDATKLKRELGWRPTVNFEEGLRRVVAFYSRDSKPL